MMKKIWRGGIPLLSILLLFVLFTTAASATTTVEISPSTATVAPGAVVDIEINIASDTSMATAQVTLNHPQSRLTMNGVPTNGGMFTGFSLPAGDILGYRNAGEGLKSSGTLANVQFTAGTTPGDAELTLTGVKLFDENAIRLPDVIVHGATITVTGDTQQLDGTTVSVIAPDSVCKGDPFTTLISITGDTPMATAQVTLNHPSSRISMDGVPTNGGMFTGFQLPADDILGHRNAGEDLESSGTLAEVQFIAGTTTGDAPLTLTGVKLFDAGATRLSDVNVVNASVNVVECTGPPTPQPDITAPADDATIVGTVAIAVEEHSSSDNISYNLIEYYRDTDGDCEANDGNIWKEIANDTTDAPWGTSWTPTGNGKYILRTTTVDETNGLVGTDEICVTVDNPIPERNILLQEGWNFISILGTLDNSTPEHVLDGIAYNALYQYNASTGIWENVVEFKPGIGYIIKSVGSEDQNIVNLVTKPAPPAEIKLYPGWNAIGPVGDPEALPGNAEDVFQAVDLLYPTVIGEWNGVYYEQYGNNEDVAAGSNPASYVDTADFTVKAFEGYWMFANAASP